MRLNFNYRDPKDLFSLFGVLFILITLPLTVVAVLTSREPAGKAAGTATMTFSPTTVSVNQNNTFTVQIRENSGTDAVNAVQADISFDTTKLDFVSFNATGSAFDQDACTTPNTLCPTAAGVVTTARFVSAGGTVTGDKLISTATFRAKPGSGNTTISIMTSSTIARSTDNTNIFNGTGGTVAVTIVNPPPTVSLTAPTNNQILGGSITATANASDDVAVTKVEFLVDGVLHSTDTTSPYASSAINTTTLTNADHTIAAKAYDALTSTTATVTIKVDNLGPTTSITSPTAGAFVKGNAVTVTATATDTNGISKVELYVDGTIHGTADTTSPYSFTWNTTGFTNASHSLTVRAYDNRSNTANMTTSSPAVSVTVDNSAPTAPVISCTAPSTTSINLSWTAATDNVGVTGYTLFKNSATFQSLSGTTTTYTDTAVTTTGSYTYYVEARDAAGNVRPSNTITCSTRKIGDINGDGNIDILDLSTLLSNWGTSNASSDLNGDGVVGILDLSTLLSKWGT